MATGDCDSMIIRSLSLATELPSQFSITIVEVFPETVEENPAPSKVPVIMTSKSSFGEGRGESTLAETNLCLFFLACKNKSNIQGERRLPQGLRDKFADSSLFVRAVVGRLFCYLGRYTPYLGGTSVGNTKISIIYLHIILIIIKFGAVSRWYFKGGGFYSSYIAF